MGNTITSNSSSSGGGSSSSGARPLHDANRGPREPAHRKSEVLNRADGFPVTVREAIAEAREEDAETFLSIVEERLVELLYGNKGRGLDSNRDTGCQIETAISLFPEALCEDYWGIHPPIYAQLAYLKSVPFVPLLARLGIESNLFREEERGGLFYREWNVLRSLLNDDWRDWYDEEKQSLVESSYASVVRSLRRMGIFRREDIVDHGLVGAMFDCVSFREETFRFLVDWDPNCFREWCTPDTCDGTHHRSSIYRSSVKRDEIRIFRTIFELGMLHYRTEMAFLFHRESDGGTPFGLACSQYGVETVMQIVRDVLVAISDTQQNSCDEASDNDNGGVDLVTNALISAATNPAVHLDGVYFLFRREPGRYCRAIAG
eukprot:jgi/Psemu1/20147/gm1.20147_g